MVVGVLREQAALRAGGRRRRRSMMRPPSSALPWLGCRALGFGGGYVGFSAPHDRAWGSVLRERADALRARVHGMRACTDPLCAICAQRPGGAP